MKGDQVIVRTYGDIPVICRVWEATPQVVVICSEENYNALSGGKEGLWPVGFSREDVYSYNPKIDISNQVAWDKLTTYKN